MRKDGCQILQSFHLLVHSAFQIFCCFDIQIATHTINDKNHEFFFTTCFHDFIVIATTCSVFRISPLRSIQDQTTGMDTANIHLHVFCQEYKLDTQLKLEYLGTTSDNLCKDE